MSEWKGKQSWQRPEAEQGAYGQGYGAIDWNAREREPVVLRNKQPWPGTLDCATGIFTPDEARERDGVQPMPAQAGSDSAHGSEGSGCGEAK